MFSADDGALGGCDVVYVAPDVPTDDRGQSDLGADQGDWSSACAASLPPTACSWSSRQVPPGYTRALPVPPAQLYYQVETLVFGRAVERATKPERFIVGCADPRRPLPPALRTFLEAFGCPILPMRYESAELAKISINFCLVASITRRQHAWPSSASGSAPTGRRSRRRSSSTGASGRTPISAPASALPAAISSATCATVVQIGEAKKTDVGVVRAWLANSAHRKDWPWQVLQDHNLKDKPAAKIAVLGLAYKENTHSTKNSPSLALLAHLRGMQVKVHDPVVPASVAPWTTGAADPLAAAEGADVLMIVTPWPQYRELKPGDLARAMKGRAVLDPYRVLDGDACAAAGLDLPHARHAAARAGSMSDPDAAPSQFLAHSAGPHGRPRLGRIHRRRDRCASSKRRGAPLPGSGARSSICSPAARRSGSRRCCGRTMLSSSSRPARRARRRP